MTTSRGDRKPVEVVIPPFGVVLDGVVGQTPMHQAHPGLATVGGQRDLHLGRAGGYGAIRLTADMSLDAPCTWPPLAHRNLRWVLLHMIEETARHAGHADIIREALVGTRGMHGA